MKKKLLAVLVASLAFSTAYGAGKPPVAVAPPAPAKEKVPALMVATSGAIKDDIHYLMSQMDPFNEWAKSEGKLMTLVPVRNIEQYREDVKAKAVPFVFCEIDLCRAPIEAGYKVVLQRTDTRRAVVLTKANGGVSLDKLANAKVAFAGNGVTRVLFDLTWPGVKPVDIGNASKKSLGTMLSDGRADAIAAASIDINEILANHPGAYKKLDSSIPLPNALILASDSASDADIEAISNVLTVASPDGDKMIWAGADHTAGSSPIFQIPGSDEKKAVKELMERNAKAAADKKPAEKKADESKAPAKPEVKPSEKPSTATVPPAAVLPEPAPAAVQVAKQASVAAAGAAKPAATGGK